MGFLTCCSKYALCVMYMYICIFVYDISFIVICMTAKKKKQKNCARDEKLINTDGLNATINHINCLLDNIAYTQNSYPTHIFSKHNNIYII